MTYIPARGGHAPSDMREAFVDAVEAFANWGDGPEPTAELRGEQVRISRIAGLLWNCTDQVPAWEFDFIQEIASGAARYNGRTYACAARWLKQEINAEIRLRRLRRERERLLERISELDKLLNT